MQVRILVTAQIELDDDRSATDHDLAASAREAMDNALALGADTGFQHELAATASIHIESIELFSEDTSPAPA